MNKLNAILLSVFISVSLWIGAPVAASAKAPSEEAVLGYLSSIYSENLRSYRNLDAMNADNPGNFTYQAYISHGY